MSTRAFIVIQSLYSNVNLYKHTDGYPGGIIPDIKELMKREFNNPDRLAQYMCQHYDFQPTGRLTSDIEWVYYIFITNDGRKIESYTVKELNYWSDDEE